MWQRINFYLSKNVKKGSKWAKNRQIVEPLFFVGKKIIFSTGIDQKWGQWVSIEILKKFIENFCLGARMSKNSLLG